MSKPRALKGKSRRRKGTPDRGPCYKEGCPRNGGQTLHCRTCEDLRDQGKKSDAKVFRVQTCDLHRDEAFERIKRHAVTAHPSNLLGWMAAALKAEG